MSNAAISLVIIPIVVFLYLLAAHGIAVRLRKFSDRMTRTTEEDYMKVVHKSKRA
jgi:hypothetical protein